MTSASAERGKAPAETTDLLSECSHHTHNNNTATGFVKICVFGCERSGSVEVEFACSPHVCVVTTDLVDKTLTHTTSSSLSAPVRLVPHHNGVLMRSLVVWSCVRLWETELWAWGGNTQTNGFAVNLQVILSNPRAQFKRRGSQPGMQESDFLRQITKVSELEPKANNCTRVSPPISLSETRLTGLRLRLTQTHRLRLS
ncbi:hypothetical protein WMY93_018101 [Mugilogobius chulae]|uniref:Galactosylgalactosylxylosylprotein 3-beta-glucuronosyltransferase n=1 Tax=Mugilogobius chulae TaxID=88201 RepID=A0AAW0NMT5_9GOBI